MQKKELSQLAKDTIDTCLRTKHKDLKFQIKGDLKYIDLTTLEKITNQIADIEMTLKEIKEIL
jgi:hypothetical protein